MRIVKNITDSQLIFSERNSQKKVTDSQLNSTD